MGGEEESCSAPRSRCLKAGTGLRQGGGDRLKTTEQVQRERIESAQLTATARLPGRPLDSPVVVEPQGMPDAHVEDERGHPRDAPGSGSRPGGQS